MSLPCRIAPLIDGRFETGRSAWLHDSAASRRLEAAVLARHPAHALMHRAGQACASLALAMAPHASHCWVAAGPGNNGGDGLLTAALLQRAGKVVHVTTLADPAHLGGDAAWALAEARQAGVTISAELPPWTPGLAIDALLGLGGGRAPQGRLAGLVDELNAQRCARLAIDLPTGLCADSGRLLGEAAVRADATLSLLTLKPGLFTGQGRDHAGEIWFSDLGADPAGEYGEAAVATARLAGAASVLELLTPRRHAQHKGSFGDLWVVGGASGMAGAAVLASRAGLAAGAGRVLVNLLADDAGQGQGDGDTRSRLATDPQRPELMHRHRAAWQVAGVLEAATVVAGCGGGDAIAGVLPALISRSARLVLDADALNTIAADPALAALLARRGALGRPTVLTPHPLEAARLLATTTQQVQADRLAAARALSERYTAIVVLKGSGSIISAPPPRDARDERDGGAQAGALSLINPTGNARLATAGSGDVLAGWLGGLWSRHAGAQARAREAAPTGDVSTSRSPSNTRSTAWSTALEAAEAAVWLHGFAAELDGSDAGQTMVLPASDLIDRLARAAAAVGRRPR